MTPARARDPAWLWVTIAALAGAVFAADLIAPPGTHVWILFLPAVVLCKLVTWRQLAPLGVAVAASALVVLGYFLTERGGAAALGLVAPLNRSLGVVALLLLGVMGRLFVNYRIRVARQEWVKAGQTGLSERIRGEHQLANLAKRILSYISEYTDARVGAMYVANGQGSLARCAGFAAGVELDGGGGSVFALGEGLVGQAAADQRVIFVNDVPEGYLDVRSGLGTAPPRSLVLVPTRAEGTVNGVLELGFFSPPDSAARELLDNIAETIGFAVRSALYRTRQAELLAESQRQREELEAQQEELKVANEELEDQTQRLQKSQEELTETNAQLEEQAQQLEAQKEAVLTSERLLREKAADVERASRYKSEFLANMSHELRTPLNSSLILAKLLIENREGNLTPEQVKYAQSIYAGGNDLLTMINEILDLARIEAGKVNVSVEPVGIARLCDKLRRRFEPVAERKSLSLTFDVERGCPETIESDPLRLEQVLTNLLSNALKFTDQGSVRLCAALRDGGRVSFVVEDTGIGIPPEQHDVIFEAFRQADGTSVRKYGGTGLGLSICRELVALLGGSIQLRSAPGEGSAFTVVLPLRPEPVAGGDAVHEPRAAPGPPEDRVPAMAAPLVRDDRDEITPAQRAILIVEDDAAFARILRDLGRELSFQCLVARDGAEALALARQYRPVAVLLDISLPDRSGLTVLELLKRDPSTRHMPVHVVSAHDYQKVARELGAVGYALKPVKRERLIEAFRALEEQSARKVRRVLVIEDDPVQQQAIVDLLKTDSVDVVPAATAQEGLARIRGETFDCCVLDLMLAGEDGFELLQRMSEGDSCSLPPVIVYTARPLSRDEEQRLGRLSHSIVVKGARSPERLLEEVTLFLHQVESELPPERQRMLQAARDRERAFEGRRVLLVEDDVRNIFALARVLEPKGLSVDVARNGKEALARIGEDPAVDIVLMDIMMPEMDGLSAIRQIRKDPRRAATPIIALTAKAMPDDRQACLQAGANDYIAKPVDVEKLLSLLRVWMPR